MANKNYWKKRLDEVAQLKFDTSYETMNSEVKKLYDKAAKQIVKEVEDLIYKMIDEELTRTELWTYKRYADFQKSLNAQMVKLGMKEINILNTNLEIALRDIYNQTPLPGNLSFTALDDTMVKQLLARPWSPKHFTSTVWDNKQQLVDILKKGITESVVLGKSKDKIVQEVMNRMGSGFNAADRVVRTELMHTINEGQRQRYKDNGYKELEILVAHDERTCPSCAPKDGTIVDIDSGDVPPFHPRCRCTIIPVLDINKSNTEIIEKSVSNNSESDIIDNKKWLDADFHTKKKLDKHLRDHLNEYLGFSEADYVNRARELLAAPISKHVDGFVDKEGFLFKYDKASNDFAIGHPGGSISTLYKPTDKYSYWLEQMGKHKEG